MVIVYREKWMRSKGTRSSSVALRSLCFYASTIILRVFLRGVLRESLNEYGFFQTSLFGFVNRSWPSRSSCLCSLRPAHKTSSRVAWKWSALFSFVVSTACSKSQTTYIAEINICILLGQPKNPCYSFLCQQIADFSARSTPYFDWQSCLFMVISVTLNHVSNLLWIAVARSTIKKKKWIRKHSILCPNHIMANNCIR